MCVCSSFVYVCICACVCTICVCVYLHATTIQSATGPLSIALKDKAKNMKQNRRLRWGRILKSNGHKRESWRGAWMMSLRVVLLPSPARSPVPRSFIRELIHLIEKGEQVIIGAPRYCRLRRRRRRPISRRRRRRSRRCQCRSWRHGMLSVGVLLCHPYDVMSYLFIPYARCYRVMPEDVVSCLIMSCM